MTAEITRAVIYGAKSTVDEKGSIKDQIAAAHAMADREGWEVVDTFSDESASAYSGNRGSGLASALARAEALGMKHGKAILVVWHSNRLARGTFEGDGSRHLIEIIIWARRHGVELRSVNDDVTFQHPMIGYMMGEMAHQESAIKSINVKQGMLRRASDRGRYMGGRRPYGYRYRDTREDGRGTGPIIPDEPEAAVVRRIFAEYVQGIPQNCIARKLMADGVSTLTGAAWYATTVAGMLRNPLYVGRVVLNGENFRGEHEPLIDPETWAVACQLRAATGESSGRGRGRRTTGRHVFTGGLLRCTCGAAMSPVTKNTRRPDRPYEVYSCVQRLHHGADACAQTPIKRGVIDGAVLRYFERVALDVAGTLGIITEQASRKTGELDALRRQAEEEVARTEAALIRIESDYITGKLSVDEWRRFEDRLTREMDAAKAQTQQQERQRQAIAEEIAQFDAEAAIAEELTALRRMVVGQIQQASHSGLDSFRAVLRRLFVGFELSSPTKPFGSGALQGQGQRWSGKEPSDLIVDGVYQLFPVVRDRAVDLSAEADYAEGFPAVRRAALSLSDNLCARLMA